MSYLYPLQLKASISELPAIFKQAFDPTHEWVAISIDFACIKSVQALSPLHDDSPINVEVP
jgi:hypothetical protein